MTVLTIFIVLIFAYSLVSARLERTILTAPMVFTAAGMFIGAIQLEQHTAPARSTLLLPIAEAGLVLLLFTDASRTDLRLLRSIRSLPARLLSAGMLLTLLLGTLAALALLPELTVWEAGILSAILAPTDAGLGQIIVSSPRVPVRIRQALNVEAGLNDGLSVPFLLFFIALAGHGVEGESTSLSRFIVEQLGYGLLAGGSIGFFGGWLLSCAHKNGWIAPSFLQLGVVALPLCSIAASETAGASMFIAAFAAGLAVQVKFEDAGRHSVEFAEQWGQLLNLFVFLLFGILTVGAVRNLSPTVILYALLSLTVVRMAPVALALAGTGLSRATVLFMGWFGPRGLASIVLGLVYLEEQAHHPGESIVRRAVIATVMLSIFAHGLSAKKGINLYAATVERLGPDAPELKPAAKADACARTRHEL